MSSFRQEINMLMQLSFISKSERKNLFEKLSTTEN